MDESEGRRRAGQARVGRLATVTPEGRPHLVPCCFALDGDVLYTAVDAKEKSTLALRRLDNIAAHPEVCLLVDHYDEDWARLWWVRIDGVAAVVRSDVVRARALGVLADKYAQYRQTPPPGPVVGIDIVRWRWWPQGGERRPVTSRPSRRG